MRNRLLVPLLLLSCQIFAQSKENERIAIGFFAGLETQSLGIQPLDTREPKDAAVQPGRLAMGTSIGFLARKHLWKGLYFQPELSIAYANNPIQFKTEGQQKHRFWDVELPIHLVATNWRRSEFPLHGCILFGGRMAWNLAKNPADLINIAPERFALDLGLGAEIKFKQWRIQPAFIYSHGLNNVHRVDEAKYDPVVGKMVRDKLTFRLSIWMHRT